MSRFNEFKKELKKIDTKTLVKKEKYWNEFYENKQDNIQYDILCHHHLLCFDEPYEQIFDLIKKYGYKKISNNTIAGATRNDKTLNTRITIEFPKSEL
jgi:hypothetical protein